MTLQTELPDAFFQLMPNDNFYCQTPLKNATFDLFYSEKCQLSWQIVTVLRATACILGQILNNYTGITTYICRWFISTTGFLVVIHNLPGLLRFQDL